MRRREFIAGTAARPSLRSRADAQPSARVRIAIFFPSSSQSAAGLRVTLTNRISSALSKGEI